MLNEDSTGAATPKIAAIHPDRSTPPKYRRLVWMVLGDETKASSRVRAYWLERPLAERGFSSTFLVTDSKASICRALLKSLRADAVILQKQYSRWHLAVARLLRWAGKPVFFDLDDTPSWSSQPRTIRRAEAMMALASGVFAGCENLAEYAASFSHQVRLVPSCIQLDEYPYPPTRSTVSEHLTLGWIGNGATYGSDFVKVMEQPLRDLASHAPFKLRIVGTLGNPVFERVFSNVPGLRLELVETIDWGERHATCTALDGVDIGLYPLLDNEPNKFKCGFKGLEYMALGVPVVATDCRAHRHLIRSGIDGVLCETSTDWLDALVQLFDDPGRRIAMGQRGRARVESSFTSNSAADLIARALVTEDSK